MKITKAIEILGGIQYQENDPNTPDIKDAIKLGREALDFCIKYKAMLMQPGTTLLPGEDPE